MGSRMGKVGNRTKYWGRKGREHPLFLAYAPWNPG